MQDVTLTLSLDVTLTLSLDVTLIPCYLNLWILKIRCIKGKGIGKGLGEGKDRGKGKG